jgi:hypothetical protein
MPEASSFPVFLRATMPQVQSPDIGEGPGCGRFRVYLANAVHGDGELGARSIGERHGRGGLGWLNGPHGGNRVKDSREGRSFLRLVGTYFRWTAYAGTEPIVGCYDGYRQRSVNTAWAFGSRA